MEVLGKRRDVAEALDEPVAGDTIESEEAVEAFETLLRRCDR